MKKLLYLTLIFIGIYSCGSTNKTITISSQEEALFQQKGKDTVHLGDAASEYDIIIIEPGFNFWLQSMANPRGYYSQSYLENRNDIMVTTWNQRVLQPLVFDPNLYEMQINWDSGIDYGYEVNYKLYYYFIYFQRKYKQRLGPFTPRI